MIPWTFLSRYTIPLIIAAIYLGDDVSILEQFEIFENTQRLSDHFLSQAKGEGQDETGNPETFEYIILGSGSAGAILANRLSESGKDRVLLLEAGGDPNPIMEIPYAQQFYFQEPNNSMDWGYSTVPQNKSCLLTGGQCPWPRGKALGGSSSVNGLLYNRGKPVDYDRWAEFTGDDSWSWDNIKGTFNSLEDYHGFYEDTNHGKDGEMYVGKIDYLPGVTVMETALREKGIPLGDLNAGSDMTFGFSKIDYNIKNGLRWGTYQAFLEPILNRTNLVIYRYAYALRVDMIDRKAVGVTYERHGNTFFVRASKEVILSAGVVESPKLLMLSGIGPKEQLEKLGISTLVDLPAVGNYLQEHPGVEVVGRNGGFRVNATFGGPSNTTDSVLEYIQNGTGPLSAFEHKNGSASQILMGYLNSYDNLDISSPDAHVYVFSSLGEDGSQQFYFSVELVKLTTSGTLTLTSSNPDDKPVIDPNLLENPADVERITDVIEQMLDIFLNSTTFRNLGIQIFEPFDDLCTRHPFPSREYWKCFIHQRSRPDFHPTSTCRMGPNETVAVVDSHFKVFNTRSLRVVDSSSMPFAPRGNTNLPTMLIGVRGAQLILSGE